MQENMLTMEQRINRIKVVLAEKQRTNKWLAENLGKEYSTVFEMVHKY